jgi:GntR family transcriptional regulator
VARELSIQRGAPVHEIVRIRTAHREPLAIERSYFPVSLFPDLLDHRLTGSIYALLGRLYDQVPRSATEALEPVSARHDEAVLLKVEPASPLMLIERTASNVAGQAIEFARDLFRPDRIKISLTTGVGQPAALESRLA